MEKKLRIYTDGACSGNQSNENLGGWGAILEFGEHRKELYGSEANTTNNRMEMTALIEAFSAIKKEHQTIDVFSDSSYLLNCFREKWYVNWQKNGWKNSKKQDVENRDLWEKLLKLVESHSINFYIVKGHVNVDSKSTNLDKHFEQFASKNGDAFSFEDFVYITRMNNRADELANMGVDALR